MPLKVHPAARVPDNSILNIKTFIQDIKACGFSNGDNITYKPHIVNNHMRN